MIHFILPQSNYISDEKFYQYGETSLEAHLFNRVGNYLLRRIGLGSQRAEVLDVSHGPGRTLSNLLYVKFIKGVRWLSTFPRFVW